MLRSETARVAEGAPGELREGAAGAVGAPLHRPKPILLRIRRIPDVITC